MKLLNQIKKSIYTYPCISLFSTFEASQLRILDHFFGVLGGGYEWANTKNPKRGGYLCEPKYYKRKDEWIRVYDKNYNEESIDTNLEAYFKEPVVEVATHPSYKQLFTGTLSEFEQHPDKQEWESSCFNLHNKKEYKLDAKYTITYNIIQSNVRHLSRFHKDNWFEFDCWQPYPNFSKDYSPFWKPGVEYIQEDWRYGALWWLQECKRYFNDDVK